MGYVQVGSCPKCGAPVYAPLVWMSILPPPSYPTCGCNAGYRGGQYVLSAGDEDDGKLAELGKVCKEFKEAVKSLKEAIDGLKDR